MCKIVFYQFHNVHLCRLKSGTEPTQRMGFKGGCFLPPMTPTFCRKPKRSRTIIMLFATIISPCCVLVCVG